MLVALFAYILQDWKDFQMTLSIIVFCMTAIWFVIPESPRWLMSVGKKEQARDLLLKGAAMNKRNIKPKDLLLFEGEEEEGEEKKKLGIASLFAK